MPEALVLREDADAVATLTLNDPDRLNALSTEMLAALQVELDMLAADPSVRVVILRGAGRAFCAGHDLREMTAARRAEDGGLNFFESLFAQCAILMTTLPKLPQPVIAEVQGVAVAAGCQLVASCDLAVAAHGARFGVNGVNIGLFCSTPMVALTRNLGRKAAFELLTTGELVEAEEARRLGLVNRVAAPEALAETTRDLARVLAGKLGPVVAIGKRAFYEQAELDVAAAYDHAGAVMTRNMLREDTAEGIEAFLAKRPPRWTQ
ncbi:enoyl-CoA hydratase [Amaricoccus sp.]|uniref:enoyl-CoA hydratase n=1 Tax=Amaricoccus sp. TaxID=1872485 RepID=UPI001B667279|nr:enoyl-CoA hydratase [Amaricoccus sp.]MBP7001190.1 enoyl-CoA hydratase [Amaricoccus sp.]